MGDALHPRCSVWHPIYFYNKWQYYNCITYAVHEAHMLTNLVVSWSTKCIEVMGYVGL